LNGENDEQAMGFSGAQFPQPMGCPFPTGATARRSRFLVVGPRCAKKTWTETAFQCAKPLKIGILTYIANQPEFRPAENHQDNSRIYQKVIRR
jgi:hypothetical protein